MKGGREMLHKVRRQTGTAGRTASNMTHISVQRRHLNEPAHTLPEKHEGAQAGQGLSIVGGVEGGRRISLQFAIFNVPSGVHLPLTCQLTPIFS